MNKINDFSSNIHQIHFKDCTLQMSIHSSCLTLFQSLLIFVVSVMNIFTDIFLRGVCVFKAYFIIINLENLSSWVSVTRSVSATIPVLSLPNNNSW